MPLASRSLGPSLLLILTGALGCGSPAPRAVIAAPPPPAASIAAPAPEPFPLGKAMALQVLPLWESDRESVALAGRLRGRLSASHPRTLPADAPSPADLQAEVVVLVSVRSGRDAPALRIHTSEAVAVVKATDLFGLEIGTRSVTYPEVRGLGADDLAELLEACTGEALEAYARLPEEERARRSREAAMSPNRIIEERDRRNDEDGERLWDDGRLADRCRDEATPETCKGVEQYLWDHPTAPHAGEASRLVDEMRAVLEPLRERAAWEAADLPRCRNPRAARDCDGVHAYFKAFPDGPHGAEAGRLLASKRRVLDRLYAKEIAKIRLFDR